MAHADCTNCRLPALPIEILGLSKCFDQSVLDNLSLRLEASKITALIGRSGCGKSTLLHILAGLLDADQGSIYPRDLSFQSAIVFQEHRLLPWATLYDNLMLAIEAGSQFCRGEKHNKVLSILTAVGLEGYEKKFPRELSGGMAQRAALGRALLQNPSYLLMDEPFASLDAITRSEMHDLLLFIHQVSKSITIFFVTHDLEEACKLADHIMVMEGGKIKFDFAVDVQHPRNMDKPEFCAFIHKLRQSIFSSSDKNLASGCQKLKIT